MIRNYAEYYAILRCFAFHLLSLVTIYSANRAAVCIVLLLYGAIIMVGGWYGKEEPCPI